MHIVQVTPYYAPAYAFGGVVRAVEGLTGALIRRGHAVTVLTTDALTPTSRHPGPLIDSLGGAQVIRVPNLSVWLRGRLNLSTPLRPKQYTAALAPADIVHLHELRTLEAQIVVPSAARAGVPVVLSPHGTLDRNTGRPMLKRLWDRWLTPRVARSIAAVIGLTDDEAADARALWRDLGLSPPLTFTVLNGIDPAEFAALDRAAAGAAFRQRYGIAPDAPVILFLGRLHPRKGVDVLVRAFHLLDDPAAHLAIAGPDEGMLTALRALAGGDARIHFTGYLDARARLEALAAADLFALPAVGEGLSLAALEALAAGVPAVLSPGCHLPQAAQAGAARIVGNDPDRLPEAAELAGALRDLLVDPGRRAQMRAAALRFIAEGYTWDAVGERMEAVYRQVRSAVPSA
jgi:glycosyltransferase involved in cell wall biosynthesis